MLEESRRNLSALPGEYDGYATTLANLALLYTELGQYTRALPLIKRALEIVLQMQQEQQLKIGGLRSVLANLHRYLGHFTDAESLYIQALETARTLQGESSLNYAISLRNLALLYIDMGKYSQAIDIAILTES